MSESPEPTAALVIIGNEILSGRTQDANLPYLAGRLNELGVHLAEVRVVPDVEARIVEAVNECRRRYTYVFTTGGIGPTHDDITAAAVARAFGVPFERNAEAVARLREHYGPEKLNDARLHMADMPVGAQLIENPVSRAPGFRIGNVFVMAGVPAIMRGMFDSIEGLLVGGTPTRSRTISCYLPEGTIARGLGEIQKRYTDVEIGSYPFFRAGRFGVSLVARGRDETRVEAAADEVRALVRQLGETPIEPEPR